MTILTPNKSFYTEDDLGTNSQYPGEFPETQDTKQLAKTSKTWKLRRNTKMRYVDNEVSGKTFLFTIVGFEGNGRVLWGQTPGKTYITLDAFTSGGELTKV